MQTDEIPAALSGDVFVSPADRSGHCVVKQRAKRKYLRLGEQEAFLLTQLDGKQSCGEILGRFQNRFGEPIHSDDLLSFVDLARKEGLLTEGQRRHGAADPTDDVLPVTSLWNHLRQMMRQAKKQSPLYFRIALYDPERSLNRLMPRMHWLFSWQLLVASVFLGTAAAGITWWDRATIKQQFLTQFGLRELFLFWVVSIVVTIAHEFGHGLACKRFGGEVHEMGVLWIFFTPCMYCNVSDAWLLPSRWQRLVVSAAGTYVDFLIWIVSVFLWRATQPGTTVNYMTWIVVSTCGVRVLFNINPFLRLDGYYALCDILGQHNLRRRARDRWLQHVRCILWGAERPAPLPDGRQLLIFGFMTWFFSVSLIGLLGFKLADWLRSSMGIAGVITAFSFAAMLLKRYFKGSLGKDFFAMFRTRKTRVFLWGILLIALLLVPVRDRVGGVFQVKPLMHWEVRAPIAGFLREMRVAEGEHVSPGQRLALIEVPELTSQIARKKAEMAEVTAILKRLNAGPRPEEVKEQQQRVVRAIDWRDLAAQDLQRARNSYEEELATLDIRIEQARNEVVYHEAILRQARQLHDRGGLPGRQLLAFKKEVSDATAALSEVQSIKRTREATGVLPFEAELARREKEIADTRAALTLLEAGNRPEDIEAETARLQRLEEELKHLLWQESQQSIVCPMGGTVITPRLTDKHGQYFERGAVICIVEDLARLEAEIAIAEHDAQSVLPGQPVTLKPRSLPFSNLHGTVDRIAPAVAASTPEAMTARKTVTVYCRVGNEDTDLRTGMTGFGRVYFQKRPLGWLIFNRGVRLLRAEMWF